MTAADHSVRATPNGGRYFRAHRAWAWVPFPAALLLVAALLRMNGGVLALLVVATGLVAVVTVPHALTGWARITGTRLAASRPFLASESPRGGVDLSALQRISSVGRKYGAFVDRGLPIFRSMFRIQDCNGGEVWIEAWGWSSQEQFFTELRQACLSCGAHVDELTFRRLGFAETQRAGGAQ